jgi:hypothetical protein
MKAFAWCDGLEQFCVGRPLPGTHASLDLMLERIEIAASLRSVGRI